MTVLFLAVGLTLFSIALAIFYRVCESFNIEHRQRLWLLKFGILLIFLTILATASLNILAVKNPMSTLLPVSNHIVSDISKSASLSFMEGETIHIGSIFLGLYLLGLFANLTSLALSFWKSKKLLDSAIKTEIGGCSVFMSEHVHSPMSFGLIKPRIYVPLDFFNAIGQKSIALALAHEEIHILNHDHRWKLMSLISRAILFFTPTMNYIHRKLELEMEIECDHATLRRTGATVQEYGELLINFAETLRVSQPFSVFAYMSDTTIKRRIVAMKSKMVPRPVFSFMLRFLSLTVAAGTAVAASESNSLPKQFAVKTRVVMAGNADSTSQFILKANEGTPLQITSTHPKGELRMIVTAEDTKDPSVANGINLKMGIEYKGEERTVQSIPQFVVLPGKEAKVSLGSDSDETVEIHVTAERQ